jgi:hypothetical protein
MAELTVSRSTPSMTASGFAGLLGLFAGLCAIFAACVTVIDWNDEISQARWPVVPAVVERADVVASARAPKDGGGTIWQLRSRVRYQQGGETRTTTVTSRTFFSEADAAKLQSWAAQHRKGSDVDLRVDPSQPSRAVFASAEISSAAGRVGTDLVLFAIAAVASAALVALAKFLSAREARAAQASNGASGGMPVLGLAFAAMGLMLVGFALYAAIHAVPFTADNLMGVPAGLMFVFAGILLGLPPQYQKWRNLLATLLITCFALTFDWVAFGPGERRFSGNIMGMGFVPGEWVGRAVFGAFAVILDIAAVTMWIGQCRRGFGPPPGEAAIEQDSQGGLADSALPKQS